MDNSETPRLGMIHSLSDLPTVRDYLNRINAETRSLRTAVVREEYANGYWKDLVVIRFNEDGTVDAPPEYEPTELERIKIQEEVSGARFPKHVNIHRLINLPEELQQADREGR